jgi:hypothetical protein
MKQDITEQLWLVTMKMAVEAKKEGADVREALALLRSAKALLNEGRLGEHSHELKADARELVEEAQREIFVNASAIEGFESKWKEKINLVLQGKKIGEYPFTLASFYPGLPRGVSWVRLPLTKKLTLAKAEEIAGKFGVAFKPHGEAHILISGDKASLRRVLKEVSNLILPSDKKLR